MTFAPAPMRARTVLKANKYFALATLDAAGPWVATLAYTLIRPSYLCFFSESTSRHGLALTNGAAVAGVIYDSNCSPADAESIQFSGWGEVAHSAAVVAEVLRAVSLRDGKALPTSQAIEEAFSKKSTLLYRVEVREAYVLDQNLFATQGIDGREEVGVADVFSGIF